MADTGRRSVVPVLRALNALVVARHPGLVAEIGNMATTKPGNARLHWHWGRGKVAGGFQIDGEVAKVIAFRRVGLTAQIRHKSQPSQGITDRDYEDAEAVLRSLIIALDEHMSGDWEALSEDWSKTADGPSGAGVVVELALELSIKVLDDPYDHATIENTPADPPGGTLVTTGALS